MQNEKMQIIGGIFLMFSQGKITKRRIRQSNSNWKRFSTLESQK